MQVLILAGIDVKWGQTFDAGAEANIEGGDWLQHRALNWQMCTE